LVTKLVTRRWYSVVRVKQANRKIAMV